MSRIPRRSMLKGAAAGSLGALIGAAAGCSPLRAARRREIPGGFVDDGLDAGHRLRDGSLGGGPVVERRARVLVIGAGVAGLSAAWRLAREGVTDIAIVDLGGEIGGTSRGGSIRNADGAALRCPFGAHYLPQPRADQLALAALLTESGIATGVSADGRVAVPDKLLVRDPEERISGLGHFEEGLWLSAGATDEDEAELARFEAEIETLIAADGGQRRLFSLPVENSSEELRSLDFKTAREWCDERGIFGKRMAWYLEYATRDDLGAALGDTSAWAFLHYFTARADLQTKESASYLTWPDGNAELVRRLEALVRPALADSGLLTREACVGASNEGSRATAMTVNVDSGAMTHWSADAVVLATPQFVTKRLLGEDPARESRGKYRYSPWLVANLHLAERPESRGFPYAWDNVIHGSPSLGYVDATHQLDRLGKKDTVWTWYLPIIDSDERAARVALLERPFESWRDAILNDLRGAHPNIDELVTRMDLWRWGHAMVKPTPGTMWGGQRAAAARPMGRLHFAHSDLSGIALFEEANWQGVRAAEEILAHFRLESESLL